MTLTNMSAEYYLPRPPQAAALTFGTGHTINGTTIKIGYIFSPPKTGNITKMVFRTGTVTSSAVFQARLETVNTSGNPTGTLFHGNGTGSQASLASNTYYAVSFVGNVPVTGNDTIAIVGASPAGSPNYVVGAITAGLDTTHAFPYAGTATGSTWTKTTTRWLMAIGYDDGLYYPPGPDVVPWDGTETVTIASTGQSYDEIGNFFMAKHDMRIKGAWFISSSNIACAIKLYTSSGTLLATNTVPAGIGRVTATPRYVYFPTTVDLVAGQEYRIMVCGTVSTAMTVQGFQMQSPYTSAVGSNYLFTGRLTGSGYVGVGTIRMNVGLIVDAMQDTGGGASGKYKAKIGGTFVTVD